jgi:acetolactate synthase I/III small subunit
MLKKKILSVIVENHPGVLARIAGLFSGRGFNIDSLAVGETEDPTTSRMTIVAQGDDQILEQIMKQLNKLIDVIKVTDMSEENHVEVDLALIKVGFKSLEEKNDLVNTAAIFRTKILDVTHDTFMIEVTGNEDKVTAFIDLLKKFGIKEMVRTGTIALTRTKI